METTTPNAESKPATGDHKKPRQRSAAYPSYTIEHCITFTAKIDKAFSSVSHTPQESISKTLGQSGGAFLMILSSSVQYGLLDKSSGEGYKPTDLFKKIQKPLPDENVSDFKLECFSKPKLYKTLIEHYKDKQLPAEEGLANTLERKHDIKGNASATAAKVFYSNVRALGLLSQQDNILRIDTYIPFVEENNNGDQNSKDENHLLLPPAQANTPPIFTPPPTVNKVREIPVFLKGGREARLSLPNDFEDDDLQRIVKVLSAYIA